MKIVNREWQRQIELDENIVYTLVFENKTYYREVVKELISQHKGLEGKFILSDKNKELQFEKQSVIITDLFNIETNSKKILTKVYGEIQKDVLNRVIEYNEITSLVREYFEKIIFNSNLSLEQGEEIDLNSFLKLGEFKIKFERDNYLDRLVAYFKVLVELLGIRVIFLVGLHQILSNEEVKLFYKEVCLNKISIINIENTEVTNNALENIREIVYIFDEENCEI